jgi:hypothetical protein
MLMEPGKIVKLPTLAVQANDPRIEYEWQRQNLDVILLAIILVATTSF